MQDLAFHIVWVFGWFIASVDWAVGFNGIRRQMNNLLTDWGYLECLNKYNLQPDTFVQASIADVSIGDVISVRMLCMAIL